MGKTISYGRIWPPHHAGGALDRAGGRRQRPRPSSQPSSRPPLPGMTSQPQRSVAPAPHPVLHGRRSRAVMFARVLRFYFNGRRRRWAAANRSRPASQAYRIDDPAPVCRPPASISMESIDAGTGVRSRRTIVRRDAPPVAAVQRINSTRLPQIREQTDMGACHR